MKRSSSSSSPEGGFTLIEVLIATSLLGLVMAALATTLILLIKTTDEKTGAGARYWQSHDAQLLAAYWGSDVESADDTNLGTNAYNCLDSASDSPMVQFRWTSRDGMSTVKVATYETRAIGSSLQVIRTSCVNGSKHASTVVIHGLSPGSPPAIVCPSTGLCTLTAAEGTFSYFVTGSRRISL